jgi:hypothetical protein
MTSRKITDGYLEPFVRDERKFRVVEFRGSESPLGTVRGAEPFARNAEKSAVQTTIRIFVVQHRHGIGARCEPGEAGLRGPFTNARSGGGERAPGVSRKPALGHEQSEQHLASIGAKPGDDHVERELTAPLRDDPSAFGGARRGRVVIRPASAGNSERTEPGDRCLVLTHPFANVETAGATGKLLKYEQ